MTIRPSHDRRSQTALVAAGLALVLLGTSFWLWPRSRVTIGVEGRQIVTIPGPKLSVVPYTHGDALAVRIAGIEPVHDGFRYDLRYMAYGPGKHDLREYFLDERQHSAAGLPEMFVSVKALLPEDESGKLLDSPPTPIDLHTNYRWGMGLMWCLWAALFVPLFLYGRKRHSRAETAPPQPTIPERLRQLLEQAAQAELTVEQQTDLEKLLLAYWAERLQRPEERLIETLDELRKHPAAGEQVRRVEKWLHSRGAHGDGNIARELLASLHGV